VCLRSRRSAFSFGFGEFFVSSALVFSVFVFFCAGSWFVWWWHMGVLFIGYFWCDTRLDTAVASSLARFVFWFGVRHSISFLVALSQMAVVSMLYIVETFYRGMCGGCIRSRDPLRFCLPIDDWVDTVALWLRFRAVICFFLASAVGGFRLLMRLCCLGYDRRLGLLCFFIFAFF